MAENYNVTRGTTVAIGTTAADATTDTYKEIEGAKILTSSNLGLTYAEIDGTVLKDDYKQPFKGVGDCGSLQIGGNLKDDPATGALAEGQAALKAAAADDDNTNNIYNIRITRPNGVLWYGKGRVFGFTTPLGNNQNMNEFNSTIRLVAPLVVDVPEE